MNLKKLLLFVICIIITITPVFSQESDYIRMNITPRWEGTSNARLIEIISNPVNFHPEEFMGALHEYARRHGQFSRVQNSVQALVNAYIAFNPEYMNQPTGEIFVWTGMSRGVPSLQDIEQAPLFISGNQMQLIIEGFNNHISQLEAENALLIQLYQEFIQGLLTEEDYVSLVFSQIEDIFHSLETLNEGVLEDGTAYIVYQVNNYIQLTIFTEESGVSYIIGNVNSSEAMGEFLDLLSNIFSEQIPHIEGNFVAAFNDVEGIFIHDDLPSYVGTFTIFGSQLFVEEVLTQDRMIFQRQFTTPEFFVLCNLELGLGWGFLASWDIVE